MATTVAAYERMLGEAAGTTRAGLLDAGARVGAALEPRCADLVRELEGMAAGAGQPGTGGLPQGSEPVNLDPADFTTRIDNPYWPMRVGTRWIYRETAPDGAGTSGT